MSSVATFISAPPSIVTDFTPKHTGRNTVQNAANTSEHTAGLTVPITAETASVFLYFV